MNHSEFNKTEKQSRDFITIVADAIFYSFNPGLGFSLNDFQSNFFESSKWTHKKQLKQTARRGTTFIMTFLLLVSFFLDFSGGTLAWSVEHRPQGDVATQCRHHLWNLHYKTMFKNFRNIFLKILNSYVCNTTFKATVDFFKLIMRYFDSHFSKNLSFRSVCWDFATRQRPNPNKLLYTIT